MTKPESDPVQRANSAAEQLAAEGQPVTARTVREKAGVMTAIATQAAKAWNDAKATEEQAPQMPPAVQIRLEGIWTQAYHAARQEFVIERQGWQHQLQAAQTEIDQLTQDATRSEETIAALQTSEQKAREIAAELNDLITTAEKNATKAATAQAAATARADAAEKALADVLAAIKKPEK